MHIKITKVNLLLTAVIVLLASTLIFRPMPKNVVDTKNVLSLMGHFNWDDMEDVDSKYHKMMIGILEHYSFKYDPQYKKSMDREQRVDYMRKNLRYAKAVNKSPFRVPTIHAMEGRFNPYAKGGYGEEGMGQMKWGTLLWCETIQRKFMPEDLKRLLRLDVKAHKDLHDPIVALKSTYTLLWWLDKRYHGKEDWVVSSYHWGGFLDRRWDGGEGDIPVSFTLNGIKYNVIKYYYSFKSLLSAFEHGQIEAGKEIVEKWQDYAKKLTEEDMDYNKVIRMYRAQKKEIKDLTDIIEAQENLVEKIKANRLKREEEFRKLGGVVRKEGWSKYKEEFTQLCKDFAKAKNISKGNFKLYIILAISIITLGLGGLIYWIVRLKKRRE